MLQRPLWKPDHVRVVPVRHCTGVDVGRGLPGGGDSKLQEGEGFRSEAMGQRMSGGGSRPSRREAGQWGPGGQLPSPTGLTHTLMLPQD